MSINDIAIRIRLIDEVSKGADAVQQSIDKTTQSLDGLSGAADRNKNGLKALAGAYNSLVIARHAAQAIAAGIKPAIDLQDAMTKLSVATGLTEENLSKVRSAAQEAAAITTFSPTESIEAAQRLNLALRDTGATVAALKPTLSLAQSYLGKDVARAARVASDLMGGFNLQSKELAPTMDMLSAGAVKFGVAVEDVTEGLGVLGVAATELNTNFAATYPLYLMSIKGGIGAREAATSLKTAFAELSNSKVRDTLYNMLGVTVAVGDNFKTTREIVSEFYNSYLSKGTVPFMEALDKSLGKRGSRPILEAVVKMREGIKGQNGEIYQGMAAWDYLSSSMASSSGFLNSMADKSLQSVSAQLQILQENFQLLLVNLLGPALPVLTSLMQSLAGVAQAFSSIAGYLQPILSVLSPLIAGFITLWAVSGMITGVRAIFGAATIWLTQKIEEQAAASLAAAQAKQVDAQASNFLSKAYVRLAGAATLAKRAVQSMWLVIKSNLVGFVITGAMMGISYLLQKFGVGRQEPDNANLEQLKLNLEVNKELGKNITNLSSAVEEWNRISKEKMPLTDQQTIDRMRSGLGALKGNVDISDPLHARLRGNLDSIQTMQNKFAKGIMTNPEELDKRIKDMTDLYTVFETKMPTDKKTLEGIKAFTESLIAQRDKSKALADRAATLGIGAQNALPQLAPRIADRRAKADEARKAENAVLAGLEDSLQRIVQVSGKQNWAIPALQPEDASHFEEDKTFPALETLRAISKMGKVTPLEKAQKMLEALQGMTIDTPLVDQQRLAVREYAKQLEIQIAAYRSAAKATADADASAQGFINTYNKLAKGAGFAQMDFSEAEWKAIHAKQKKEAESAGGTLFTADTNFSQSVVPPPPTAAKGGESSKATNPIAQIAENSGKQTTHLADISRKLDKRQYIILKNGDKELEGMISSERGDNAGQGPNPSTPG